MDTPETDEVVETPAAETPSLRDELEAQIPADTPSTPAKPVEESVDEVKVVAEVGKPAEPTEPAPVLDEMPKRLSGKLDTVWAGLAPEVKGAIREYETHIGRLANKFGRAAKSWEQAEQVFAPYADMVAREGGDFFTATRSLFETARILRQGSPDQKVHLFYQMAQAFGVPLTRTQEGLAALPPLRSDPTLITRANQLEAEHSTAAAQREYDRRQETNEAIDSFISDPANVYTQEPGYLDTMAALIESGRAKDLQDAYSQAAWLHESTRAIEIAKRNQPQAALKASQAAAARTAAVSVPGSAPGTPRIDPAKLSTRDAISAAMDGLL